ncbi:MAG: flagellar assembly protein FliX [Rhodospirillaceae bacterium]
MSIKIDSSSSLRSGSVKRAGKSEGGSGGKFSKAIGHETATTSSVATANPVTAVDGLLTLQEVDDAAARASAGKRRAQDLLEGLDDIRHSLLTGGLSRDKLMALAKHVQSRRAQVDDPRLGEILDEIDLRAQVELAKYRS